MASTTLILLLSVAFLAGVGPSAASLVFNNEPIVAVDVRGVLYCTVDGNPPSACPYSVVAGVPVDIRCANGSLVHVVKTVLTDVSGAYVFVFDTADALLFDPAKCYIAVDLPLLHCGLSLPTGILRAPISVLGIVQLLLGNLLYGIAGPFTHVL